MKAVILASSYSVISKNKKFKNTCTTCH